MVFYSQFTACPEGFGEFFNQRRRWMPSTIANILEILSDYKNVVKANPDISLFFIAYQVRICELVKPCREDLRLGTILYPYITSAYFWTLSEPPNQGKMLTATSVIFGRICPLGWDRIKVTLPRLSEISEKNWST